MSNFTPTDIFSEIGRMLWGNIYEARMEDFEGNPLKPNKDGSPNTGYYEFGLGIPKNPGETHWANSPFGAIIWAQGHRDHPQSAPRPDFAWKVTDGDSAQAGKPYKGKPGRAPKDKEGFPGNWVYSFRGAYAPKIVNSNGSAYILDKDVVMPGDAIQVSGSVVGNTGATPGVYLNYTAIMYHGRHRDGRISTGGVDLGELQKRMAGQAVPAWVVGGSANVATSTGAPPAPNQPAPPPPQQQQVPQVPVQPAAGFVPTVPTAPGSAVPPPPGNVPPAPPAGPQMTAKANGNTYASFIAGGWTDAGLRAHGYLV